MPESTFKSAPAEADVWLAAVAQHRDRDAFARLFRHYAPRIRSYLINRGATPPMADELAQDALLTVWRKSVQFDPSRGNASAWIFTIARNGYLSARRRQRPEVEADDPALVVNGPVVDARGSWAPVEADAMAMETQRALVNAVNQLPAEQAETLRGAYFRGRTLREMAEEQSIPLGTVKTRVRLGLERLRTFLRAEKDL